MVSASVEAARKCRPSRFLISRVASSDFTASTIERRWRQVNFRRKEQPFHPPILAELNRRR
jgi:hypothetical protein